MDTKKCFFVVLIAFFLITTSFPFNSRGEDWIITSNKTIEGKTITLSKNLVIESGAKLTLKNVTLIFNYSWEEQYGIDVNGTLYVYNSTIKSKGEHGFHFYVNEGGSLKIENCTIINAHSSLYLLLVFGSIVLRNADATIRNCEFINSGYLTLYNSNATVYNSYFHNSSMCVKIVDSNLTFSGCEIYAPLHGGTVPTPLIIGNGGSIDISNCKITNNMKLMPGSTIYMSDMQAKIRNCIIKQYAQSLYSISPAIFVTVGDYQIINVSIYYNDSTPDIEGNYAYGIYGKEAIVDVKDCVIDGCDYGIKCENTQCIVEGSLIKNNERGIEGEDSQMIINCTVFKYNTWGVISSSSTITIQYSEITENTEGIWIKGEEGGGEIHYCNIYNNTGSVQSRIGLRNSLNATIDARYNYWGSPDGPSDFGKGNGDRIIVHRGNVLYEPWLSEPVGNITSTGKLNLSVEMPLLTIQGFVQPRIVPGRKSVEMVILKNEGNKDAEFLVAIMQPFYLEVLSIEGGSIVAEAEDVKIVDVYLKAGERKYLKIKFKIPPDNVFGENASISVDSKYLPCIVAEFASLGRDEWEHFKNQGYDIDTLLDKAWRLSQEKTNEFFSKFKNLTYEEQINILLNLSTYYPALADYIAWSIIYDKFDEEIISSEDEQKQSNQFSSLITPVVASPQYETPTTAWGWTKWYVKEFFNKDFLPTAWEGLKGFGAGVLESLTFGIVDIEAKNDYMQVGKTIGSITTDIEVTLLSLGGLGKAAGKIGSKMGIEGVNFFSRMSKTAKYRTLLGLEARYSNGAYGNIIKIAENKRFGGWYLGIGHHRLKVNIVGGKKIYPGWFHFYFSTGKIATWSPRIMNYAEMNLYSSIWNSFKRTAPFLLASSLVGDISGDFKIVRSYDPNYMESSPDEYITDRNQSILYTVHFENLENATAPAYDIRIEIPLDKNLDESSVKLLLSSHPEKLKYFNISDGKIIAIFKDIELPPNKNPPEGEGWFSFSVNLSKNIKSGAEIIEKAKVYFDYNPPIETNEVILIFDDTPPITTANAKLEKNEIVATANGSDKDTGIKCIDIRIVEKGSDKMQQVRILPSETAHFASEPGKTYYIFSSGIDGAGNIEIKSNADAIIGVPVSFPLWILFVVIIIAVAVLAFVAKRRR